LNIDVIVSVHSHGVPTGEAAAFMIRPTTAPSASTSKVVVVPLAGRA
jgi:hypothetical protein